MNRGVDVMPRGVGNEAMAPPCPDCAADHYEILYEEGRYFATCPSCGRRGPDAPSLYEATMGWRQMHGRPAQSMRGMVIAITAGLCVIGVGLAVAVFVLR